MIVALVQYAAGGLAGLVIVALVAATVRVTRRRRRQEWVLPARSLELLVDREDTSRG